MGELRFDGLSARELAAHLDIPECVLRDRVSSTMDVAHQVAALDADAGTLVLAQAQDSGRGRGGRRWESPEGLGLWMTLIERPASAKGIEVLSLRIGLALAEALDLLAGTRVGLKWPNDLYANNGKLAGVLVEARWRDKRVEWVAIGIGLNVIPPVDMATAVGLAPGATRLQALERIIPAVRWAASAEGSLTPDELVRFASRDIGVGRSIKQPAHGVVAGIGDTGELMVDTAAGQVACRSGSLVFAEDH